MQKQHLLTCALADNKNAQGTAADISKLLHVNRIDVRRQAIALWKFRELLKASGVEGGKSVFRVRDGWTCMTRN